jgi:hypothetical protein
MSEAIDPLLAQLNVAQSPKRRAAAKKLRKLRVAAAGPALLHALEREVRDPRTWETQYQMIMALGESGYREALPLLESLAQRALEATMLYVGLGDAIVRLSQSEPSDVAPVIKILRESENPMLVDGAFRAMAMLRLVPRPAEIAEILARVSRLSPADDGHHFWVAAATPGWRGPSVDTFLDECSKSSRLDLQEATALARAGKYKQWRPL